MASSENADAETIIIPDLELGAGVEVIEMDQAAFENCELVDINTAMISSSENTTLTTTAFVINPDTGEVQLVELSGVGIGVDEHEELEVTLVDDKQLEAITQMQTINEPFEMKILPSPSQPKLSPMSRMKNAPALLRSRRNASQIQTSTSLTSGSQSQSQSSRPSPSKPIAIAKQRRSRAKPAPATTPVPQIVIVNGGGDEIGQIELPNLISFQNVIGMDNATQNSSNAPGFVIYQTETKGDEVKPLPKPKVTKPTNKKPRAPRKRRSDKPRKLKDLKCMEPGCAGELGNIVELRSHLKEEHDMTLATDDLDFPNDSAFNDWRAQYERERMVSFIYRGGTKKISKDHSVTYMVCHRSGYYKSTVIDTSKRQRRMKPQGSCKIGGYCTAGIKKTKNLESGAVKAEICHTHYGHPLDSEAIPHLRVNPALKKIILKKFEEGMNFPDMLAYIHHNPDGLEGLRVVDRRAVRNIYEQWKKPKNENSKPKENCLEDDNVLEVIKSDYDNGGDNVAIEENASNGSPIQISISSFESLKPESEMFELKSISPRKRKAEMEKVGGCPVKKKKKLKNSKGSSSSTSSSPSKTSFRLHPNRKVQVYKKKKSKKAPDLDSDCSNPDSTESDLEDPLTEEDQSKSDLDMTIDRLHNHGESGPTILFYKKIGDNLAKYGGLCRSFKENDFCLIIQTPVQRQIMQMFSKIVCVEMLENNYAQDNPLKLAYVSVLDDFREAIPVAWMVSDSMSFKNLNQFFKCLKEHCGELAVKYIMAPRDSDVLRAWTSHFPSTKPKMLQDEFCVKRELRSLLNRNFSSGNTRDEAWALLEKMIYGKNLKLILEWKKDLINLVKKTPSGPTYLQKLEKDWLSRIEEWSFGWRFGSSPNLQFISDGFTKLRKFVSFKGTKRLNHSIDHILKIGYDKCFLRTKRMFKGDQKFSHLLEKMEEHHLQARDLLKDASIEEGDSDHSWIVGEFQVFHLQSPCDCKVQCKSCDVCVHEYTCSCGDFRKYHVMCKHIHKVHCHLNSIPMDIEVITPDLPEENHFEILPEDLENNDKSSGVLCDGQEITIINQNAIDIDAINLPEVLQAAGLFGNGNGEVMGIGSSGSGPKIISISEGMGMVGNQAASSNILGVGEGEFGPIVFRLE